MNGKTAKLLRKYNSIVLDGVRKDYQSMKKWWYNMNRHERTKARKELQEAIKNEQTD